MEAGAIMPLPPGFQMEQPPQSGGLPAGFQLENKPPENPSFDKPSKLGGLMFPGPRERGFGLDRLIRGQEITPDQAAMNARNTAATEQLKEGGWGTGVPKMAYEAGGNVTDATGSPGLGYATNVATQAIPALLSSFKPLGAPEASLLSKPATRLMQSAVKPSLADRESGRATTALKTMLDEGIAPTSGGMSKTSDLARELHKQVEAAISGSSESVGAMEVGSRLKPLYDKAKMQVDPHADMRAVEGAWDAFKTSPAVREQGLLQKQFGPVTSNGDTLLPVQLANELKKGTYRSLGEKAYGEVGTASTEAQKALARGLREIVAERVPSAVEPLKREASLMNVKDVAMNAVMREGNKDLLGISALRVDNPYVMATSLADRWGALKGMGALALNQAGKPSAIPPVGVALGTANQSEQQRMAELIKKRAQ